jgi:stalled ribosome rescue protein Dom34
MAASRKKIGIWMDHSMAHLMEYSKNPFEIKTIESNFTQQQKLKSFKKGEAHMHNKELYEQSKYYKKLIDVVKKYKEVILFGPTNAKTEFFNYLSEDNRFVKIKVYIKETDKMNAFQRQNFINDYFSNPLYK